MHLRQQIRDYVYGLLFDNTGAFQNVFKSRVYPVDGKAFATILIYTDSETAEPAGLSESSDRELILKLEVYIKEYATPDNLLDDIAAEIEILLSTNCAPLKQVLSMNYTGLNIEFSGSGDKPLLVGTMEYSINYWVENKNPEGED